MKFMKLTNMSNLQIGHLGLLVLLLFSAMANVQAEERNPREYFFSQTFGDLPEELALAKSEGKQGMLLFFEADACPYCQRMLKKVFNQKRVQDWYRERFLSLAIDIHGDVELKDFDGITLPSKVFSDHRKVFLTPVISFLNLDGEEIYRHVGMIKTADQFLLLGEFISDKHYFRMGFKKFSRMRALNEIGETK